MIAETKLVNIINMIFVDILYDTHNFQFNGIGSRLWGDQAEGGMKPHVVVFNGSIVSQAMSERFCYESKAWFDCKSFLFNQVIRYRNY